MDGPVSEFERRKVDNRRLYFRDEDPRHEQATPSPPSLGAGAVPDVVGSAVSISFWNQIVSVHSSLHDRAAKEDEQ